MMLLKKLKELFVIRRKSNYLDNPVVHPLDIDELKKELDVKAEAKRLGERNIPNTSDISLTSVEKAVAERLEAERRRALNWASGELKEINKRLSLLDITKVVNRNLQVSDEFALKANSYLSDVQPMLQKLNETAIEKKSVLEDFKVTHARKASAKPDSKIRTAACFFFVLLVIVFEGAVNGRFFAHSFDNGLIDGIMMAVLIAALNVAFAFVLGRLLFPYTNHVNKLARVKGYLSVVLLIGSTLSIGLAAGHLRDSFGQGVNSEITVVASQALESLISHPFVLKDMFSWLLTFLTVFFGVASFIDGYVLKDKYPGYGKVQYEADKARDDYEHELNECRQELAEIKEAYLKGLDDDLKEAQKNIISFKAEIQKKKASCQRLTGTLDVAANIIGALIALFRTENKVARTTPAPSYFDQPLQVQKLDIPDFSTHQDESSLAEQQKLLDTFLASVDAIRAQIQASFDSKFDQITPVRDQL